MAPLSRAAAAVRAKVPHKCQGMLSKTFGKFLESPSEHALQDGSTLLAWDGISPSVVKALEAAGMH